MITRQPPCAARLIFIALRLTGDGDSGAVARLTLALLTPLLASQSRTDSTLVPATLDALLAFLASLSPAALKVCGPFSPTAHLPPFTWPSPDTLLLNGCPLRW
jgi:hypothetical protein